MSFQCWNFKLKKYPSWFEKASKKLSRVSSIKFSSEVAFYFIRKINQMMQDIHISLILLTLFPLGFLWSVSQGSSAWSTWRVPMPNIIPPQDRKELLLPYWQIPLETAADLGWPKTIGHNRKRHFAKVSEKFLAPKAELRRNRKDQSKVYQILAQLSGVQGWEHFCGHCYGQTSSILWQCRSLSESIAKGKKNFNHAANKALKHPIFNNPSPLYF